MKNLALALSMLLILYLPVVPLTGGQRLAPPRSYHSEDDDDEQVHEDVEDIIRVNATDGSWLCLILVQFKGFFFNTEKGLYVGAPCEGSCSTRLQHVYCNPLTSTCECDKKYPVKLSNPYSGCSKRKYLHYIKFIE